jgi:UDP-N-acetyl-D-glucosamine dehydrogenase
MIVGVHESAEEFDEEYAVSLPRSALIELIESRQATVAVMGLGYVGLPLVKVYLEAGFNCIGYDVDESKILSIRAGRSYINYIGDEWIAAAVNDGRFVASTEPSILGNADCVLICVPTPLSESRDPDLGFVEATAKTLVGALRAGQLVVLESTTYPGTTRDVVAPILATSGLDVGTDVFLAYSPEREDPGNRDFGTGTIPKVVGGCNEASLELACALYRAAIKEVVPVSSCEVAEACKILENTYRSVNIALVNELKIILDRMGVDVWEVIDAASTKPFGFQRFTPGPGLGGHCIPIDPFYLAWVARKHGVNTRFIELAGEINHSMPAYVVNKIAEALNDRGLPIRGSRISILGVAYKPNVDDPRESPAFAVMELLLARGAVLSYNDPHIAELGASRSHELPAMKSESLTPEYLKAQDAVVVITDHAAYDWDEVVANASLVIDTRNATRSARPGSANVVLA